MRRTLLVVLASLALLIGTASAADAMADPFPTCIRDCSPVPRLPELPRPGPCSGLAAFC